MTNTALTTLYGTGVLKWSGQVTEMNAKSVGETGGRLGDGEENWTIDIFLGLCGKNCRHHKLRSFSDCVHY